MQADNNILIELKALSPLLAGISNRNIFSVPEGYFETLSEKLVAYSKEEVIIDKKETNFKVPEGYFDSLSSLILDKLTSADAGDELKLYSPLLYSIRHTETYNTPVKYFNELPINLLKKVKPAPVKVFTLGALGRAFKYAAAAVLVGVISLLAYKYIGSTSLNKNSVVPYAALTPAIEKGKRMNEQQFNEELSVLSNMDISTYFEKNGSEEDIALITPDLKENDIPNKDDYFLDVKTLDNYLASIGLKN